MPAKKTTAAKSISTTAVPDAPVNLKPGLHDLDPKSLDMQKQVRVDRSEKADKELLASITERGILLPIRVRISGGKLVVIDGHRRTEAALEAGLKTIPAIVVSDVSDTEAKTDQLVANIQREDLSLLDTARAVRDLHNGPGGGLASYTAKRLSKSAAWVSKMLLIAGGDKADTSAASIAQKLLAADKIGDLESAYLLTKLEAVDPVQAQEVADNIENESRATINKRLKSIKAVKAPAVEEETQDDGPMLRWILKLVKGANVSRRDAPLQEAAAAMLEEMIGEEAPM